MVGGAPKPSRKERIAAKLMEAKAAAATKQTPTLRRRLAAWLKGERA